MKLKRRAHFSRHLSSTLKVWVYLAVCGSSWPCYTSPSDITLRCFKPSYLWANTKPYFSCSSVKRLVPGLVVVGCATRKPIRMLSLIYRTILTLRGMEAGASNLTTEKLIEGSTLICISVLSYFKWLAD